MKSKFNIAIVADIDSSSMGKDFASIEESEIQKIWSYTRLAIVRGAPDLDALKGISQDLDGPFHGMIDVGNGGIATPESALSKVEAALTLYRETVGLNLHFKEWIYVCQPTLQGVQDEQAPDFKCFRLVYEDGRWRIIYNAMLELKGTRDKNFEYPLKGHKFKKRNSTEEIELRSYWLATLTHEFSL